MELDYKDLDNQLTTHQWFGGDNPNQRDKEVFDALEGEFPSQELANLWSWYLLVSLFNPEVMTTWKLDKSKKSVKKPKQSTQKHSFDDLDSKLNTHQFLGGDAPSL